MSGHRFISTLLLALAFPALAVAGPRDELLTRYTSEARAADAGFSGFSAARGEALYRDRHAGGKPDTPACASCHANDPRKPGQTPTGKSIDPVAVSVSPNRYTDPAKVEKWFRRNCKEVLGRQCSPLEKGDWLTWMISQ
ncbi:MAG: DUF1924 domain-containing protein [Azoarcus sp.]|nr:DUF1924 domain-containing protein [Azoarcus sp.]